MDVGGRATQGAVAEGQDASNGVTNGVRSFLLPYASNGVRSFLLPYASGD